MRDTKHSHEHLIYSFCIGRKSPHEVRSSDPHQKFAVISVRGSSGGEFIFVGNSDMGSEVPTPLRSFTLPPTEGARPMGFIFVGNSDMVSEVPTNTLTAQQRLVFGPRVYIPLRPPLHLLLPPRTENTPLKHFSQVLLETCNSFKFLLLSKVPSQCQKFRPSELLSQGWKF